MKLGRPLVWLVLVAATVAAVEGSLLLRKSLLRPRSLEDCFSCSTSDRPFYYPLIGYFGKIKDVFVRAFKEFAAKVKDFKLDYK